MNIEVGEYIRTKQGDIDKVILEYAGKCANPNCSAKHISCKSNYYDEEDIVNHSKNIIDLIEVNDIVTYWIDTQSYNGWVQDFVDKELLKDMKKNFIEEDIKSIVTHEQIEKLEYRL